MLNSVEHAKSFITSGLISNSSEIFVVISKSDQVLVKNKPALPGQSLHCKPMGKLFHPSRGSNSKLNNPTWPKFELI